jgi:hypothetical protein
VNITASDGNEGTDWSNFTLSVYNVNDVPLITNTPWMNSTEDVYYHYKMLYSDEDPQIFEENHEWTLIDAPSWLRIDQYSGELFGTPSNEDVGRKVFSIKISDDSSFNIQNITLFVENVNDNPTIDPMSPIIVKEDETFNLTFTFKDIDPTNDIGIWSIEESNAGFLSIDPQYGIITGTASNEDVGQCYALIKVDDGNGGWNLSNVTIIVLNINDPPIIINQSLPDAVEDEHYSFFMEASDPDPVNDTLSWTIDQITASFLVLDPVTGELSGTPGNDDVGSWPISINVSDGEGGYHSVRFILKVIGTNDPPTLNLSSLDLSCKEDGSVILNLNDVFLDIDGDLLTFETAGSGNISVSISGFTATVKSVADWSGSERITFTARDLVSSVKINATVTVTPVNDHPTNPVITSGEYREGENQVIKGSVFDPDLLYGDSLTFTWFSNVYGKIGTGESIDLALKAGSYLITLNVTDSNGAWVTTSKTITVLPPKDVGSGPSGNSFTIIAIVLGLVLLVLIVGGAIFLFTRSRKDDVPPIMEAAPIKDPLTEVPPNPPIPSTEPMSPGEPTVITPAEPSTESITSPTLDESLQSNPEQALPEEFPGQNTAQSELEKGFI